MSNACFIIIQNIFVVVSFLYSIFYILLMRSFSVNIPVVWFFHGCILTMMHTKHIKLIWCKLMKWNYFWCVCREFFDVFFLSFCRCFFLWFERCLPNARTHRCVCVFDSDSVEKWQNKNFVLFRSWKIWPRCNPFDADFIIKTTSSQFYGLFVLTANCSPSGFFFSLFLFLFSSIDCLTVSGAF